MFQDAIEQINRLATQRTPFIFIFDFDMANPLILPVAEADPAEMLFDFNGYKNFQMPQVAFEPVSFIKYPMPFASYKEQFEKVKREIQAGNTYLLNLTCETPVKINLSLKEIFYRSHARYKIWYRDEWVVFSPESFIRIKGNCISTYPMKGTIDAALPDAEHQILSDPKETAEHHTIVDLLRNDLSMIASHVRVRRFRYIDRLETSGKTLLQVSSEITGELPADYRSSLGERLFRLLPAGSVSGAPKEKTVAIIHETETHQRGFYTGICGYDNGQSLDSGVMIRFIEQRNRQYYYKSGGGITFMSNAESEYQEMLDKVYVPVV